MMAIAISSTLFASAQFKTGTLQAAGLTCAMCTKAINETLKELSFTEENRYRQHIEELVSGIYMLTGYHHGAAVRYKLVVSTKLKMLSLTVSLCRV